MRWDDFLKEKKEYQFMWQSLKEEFSQEMGEFLAQSYMVVVYGCKQIAFEVNEPFSMAVEHPGFFMEDATNQDWLRMAKEYKGLRPAQAGRKFELAREASQIKPETLSVVDFQIELRFPTTAMSFIQRLKQSRYCDQEKTNMTTISIRVVLKRPENVKGDRQNGKIH